MPYIGAPPGQFVIPVTLGADREFSVNRVDSAGNPVDWAATVFMAIDVDRNLPTMLDATVVDNQATFIIHSATGDQVKTGTTRWRLYMQTGTAPNALTTPIAVGYFERDDGGKP